MSKRLSRDKLLDVLVKSGRLEKDKVDALVKECSRDRLSIFGAIAERGYMSEEEVTRFLSENLTIPMINLKAIRVPKEILQLVPKKLAERYTVVPLSRIGRLITVVTSSPFELMLKDDLKELTGCEVCLVLAPKTAIMQSLEGYYSDSGSLDDILDSIDEDTIEVIHDKGTGEDGESLEKMRKASQDAPVTRMVNLILDEGLRRRASDIHFEPYEKEFRVRYRIDGVLKEAYSHGREMYGSMVARTKIMSQLDITQKRIPQDGRFRVSIGKREIDFRVSILPTYFGEKIVLRILDRSGIQSGLDRLGFTGGPTAIFADAIKNPYGMILVTGPTGSGKSTTLYTILNTLNTMDRNLMTVEDPVEYQVEGITQTQVNPEVGLSFASGLRALLRQNPDIILVGEIRDTETADIAVKSALTGHLVFSTLHTNSAAGAVTRLMDMGIEPFLIASSIVCVAAQRLMRRICDLCKVDAEISDELLRRCGLDRKELEGVAPKVGKGCSKCNDTGYYGRLGCIEVLKMTTGLRNLVIQRKSSDVIHNVAVEEGMETLFKNAFSLFKAGKTTLEEVLRVTSQG